MRGLVLVALLLAGCEGQMTSTVDSPGAPEPVAVPYAAPVGIRPIPPIPLALRGCWDSIPPEDPDEPGGHDRLIVNATSIEQRATGVETSIATAEFVTKVTPHSIEGRFSSPDGNNRSTLATSLSGDGGDAGASETLTRQEGDAGSTSYSRCKG